MMSSPVGRPPFEIFDYGHTMRHQLHHTLLTSDEERSLLLAAQGGNADALEEIVCHNQRLVYRIAVRYHRFGYGGDQELTDLMQWGNI